MNTVEGVIERAVKLITCDRETRRVCVFSEAIGLTTPVLDLSPALESVCVCLNAELCMDLHYI